MQEDIYIDINDPIVTRAARQFTARTPDMKPGKKLDDAFCKEFNCSIKFWSVSPMTGHLTFNSEIDKLTFLLRNAK